MAIQLINHLFNNTSTNCSPHIVTSWQLPKPSFTISSTTSSSTKSRSSILTGRVYASSTNGRQLIQSGTVRPIRPSDAAAAITDEGFVVLDIRPAWEREKAHVRGSLYAPLFVADRDNSLLTLLKKWVHFGYVGLWTGQSFTTLNPDFLRQVEEAVPDKSAKLLVACGEGLRSVMAASKLYEAGYKNLGWLAGGFNRGVDGDFPDVEGTGKLEYATIGDNPKSKQNCDYGKAIE
ncbi:hypothetical protein L484_008248 [Morus notabilis]|uniref:Rhodanese domain-containing protein n=1 Tax=Morus notabilis TaxID=981085 RepID=W9QYD1_9ROSA|nr:hypothetical protein L484_008248 [Morus notabilis]